VVDVEARRESRSVHCCFGRGSLLLLRASPSCRRKRSVLVHLRRGPDGICVTVWPAWPVYAATRHILSDTGHFVAGNDLHLVNVGHAAN
jgi:hypothetical protein